MLTEGRNLRRLSQWNCTLNSSLRCPRAGLTVFLLAYPRCPTYAVCETLFNIDHAVLFSMRSKVMFLTGTDEHGQKVEASALKADKSPQQFCDEVSQEFK